MAKKKLMSIEDLYNFCLINNFNHFNCDEDGAGEICVQFPAVASFANEEDNKHLEGLVPFVAKAYHDNINLNKSCIDPDVFKENTKSSAFRPILANIVENEDGELDFGSHDFEVVKDQDGNEKVVYYERPVGVIGTEYSFEYDEEADVTRAILNGYLYEEYCQDAIDILQRRNGSSCSIELSVRELSFDAKKKTLMLDDFYIRGLTLLSASVKPGMANSRLDLADFTSKENTMFEEKKETDNKLVETLEKLNNTLESFNKEEFSKKGGQKDVNKIEELLAKYSKTIEDVTFETEGLSDEELEKAFSEAFEEETEVEDEIPSEENTEETVLESEEQSEEESVEEVASEEPVEETAEEVDPETVDSEEFELKPTRETLENGNVRVSYELSHEDVRTGLYGLISMFEEEDNDWYEINQVFDNKFIFTGLFSGNIYGCKYKTEDNVVSFDGERYKLFAEYLTETEKANLDEMRSNYALISEKLSAFEKSESDAEKDAVFADELYQEYIEEEEFAELKEHKDEYSVEELKEKAEIAYAKCVRKKKNKNCSLNSAHKFAKPSTETGKKKSAYGNIFKNKD